MVKPAVSVIIPYHGRQQLVARALASVFNQTVTDFEVILIDDASPVPFNPSQYKIRAPIIHVRHDARRGAAAARNSGIANSTGKYLCFLDSDDVWLPTMLECQLEYVGRRGSFPLCCTSFESQSRGSSSFTVRRHKKQTATLSDLAFGCGLSPGSTLCVDAEHFHRIGRFDEALGRLEDWDWLIRASQLTPIGLLAPSLARIHASRPPDYEVVMHAVSRLLPRHANAFKRIGFFHHRRFRAALETEAAAASFCAGSKLRALKHFGKSVIWYPLRDLDTIRRILRRIMSRNHSEVPNSR